jgi:hypothetical protein
MCSNGGVGAFINRFEPEFKTFKEPYNRFQGTSSARLCSLAGHYNNPIPIRFQWWAKINDLFLKH